MPDFLRLDLLYLNGRDYRQLPLLERKEKLRALIEKSGLPDVICGKYVVGRGIDLFNEVCQRNLEGVVAKRKRGRMPRLAGGHILIGWLAGMSFIFLNVTNFRKHSRRNSILLRTPLI